MRVILVRHGETEWNRLRRVQGGGSDTPLNERGKQQVEALGLRLKTETIQAVYSSPLQRSRDTAQAIARHCQKEVNLEPAFLELRLGELEGVLIDEVGRSFNELLITSRQGEVLPKVPGGESLVELQQRAWSAIQRLVSQHTGGDIIVVSHSFVILSIICSVLDLSLTQIGRFRISPASISSISFDRQPPRLILFNDTHHLNNG